MQDRKFAILVDIDNVSFSDALLEKTISYIEKNGEIVYGKFYGFSDRKHKELADIINSRAFDVAQRMRLKRKNKSSQDTRILIDAIKIACTNPVITAFCIIGGEGDYVPLVTTLKAMGKYVAGGFIGDQDNLNVCDEVVDLDLPLITIHKQSQVKKVPIAPKVASINANIKVRRDDSELSRALNQVNNDSQQGELEDIFDQIRQVVDDFDKISSD